MIVTSLKVIVGLMEGAAPIGLCFLLTLGGCEILQQGTPPPDSRFGV